MGGVWGSFPLAAAGEGGGEPAEGRTGGVVGRAGDERDADDPRGEGVDADHAEFGPELDLGTEKEAGDFDGIEGHGGRSVDRGAGLDVDGDHRNPDGPEELVENLDNGLVKLQRGGDDEAENRRETEKREQREGDTEAEGEGDAVGGDALRELGGDRADDAATEERGLGRGGIGRGGRGAGRDRRRRRGRAHLSWDQKPRM